MDIDRCDPDDDDVTIVGDHELVVELRRIASQTTDSRRAAVPPPPPAPALSPSPSRRTAREPGALRGPAPAAPSVADAGAYEWWYDEDDEAGRSGLVWVALAMVVAAAVVIALLVVR